MEQKDLDKSLEKSKQIGFLKGSMEVAVIEINSVLEVFGQDMPESAYKMLKKSVDKLQSRTDLPINI